MKEYFAKFGHTCDLKEDEQSESSARVYDKKWLHGKLIKWITVDPTSNLTLQHLNSHSTVVREKKFHLSNHPMTIHPFSRCKMLWECVMLSVFLCGLIYAPMQYLDYVDKVSHTNIGNLAIMKWVKGFCLVDMTFRFFTGYWDGRNFVTVLSRKKIALKYLRGLFTSDLLTNVPLMIGLMVKVNTHFLHFIKNLTLFRIFRLVTTVRYFERIFIRMEIDEKYVEIFKLLFYWLICVHWAACLHIVPGLIAGRFNDDAEVDAWYENEIFMKHTHFGKYVICLFKSVKTFMGTGYIKDLQPTQHFDKIYASLLTIVGRVGLCVTLAYIYEIMQGMRSSSLLYDKMMVQLNKYTDQNKLPASTKAKLRNNYDYMFSKRYFNEREILKTVSAPLRQQILVHNTRQLVENSPFFENLPSSLVLRIISALSVELYLDGDVIFTMGEIGTSVYFITSGSVAFYSPNGREVCHFSDGDYFGEMTLVSDAEHHLTKVVALETTECYKLGKDDFKKLIQSYPDLLQKVETLAIERIERVLMIEEREKHRKPFRYVSINQR